MASQTKTVLKSYFEAGDKPTAAQFTNLIDTLASLNSADEPVVEYAAITQALHDGAGNEVIDMRTVPATAALIADQAAAIYPGGLLERTTQVTPDTHSSGYYYEFTLAKKTLVMATLEFLREETYDVAELTVQGYFTNSLNASQSTSSSAYMPNFVGTTATVFVQRVLDAGTWRLHAAGQEDSNPVVVSLRTIDLICVYV